MNAMQYIDTECIWNIPQAVFPCYYPEYRAMDRLDNEVLGMAMAYLGTIMAGEDGYNKDAYTYLQNAKQSKYSSEARQLAQQALKGRDCVII